MSRHALALHVGLLLLFGTGWGLTQPLTKIAVSTGHQPLGLIFWQLVIGAGVMAAVSLLRGRGLPVTRRTLALCLIIALVGTLVPNAASYRAIMHLPAGLMSILMSLIPMMAFPIALGLGLEPFSVRRFGGLAAGLAGVLLLVLPEASLPDRSMLAWLPLALVAPLCYGVEGNAVNRMGMAGLSAVQLLFLSSATGLVAALPLALFSGQFIPPSGLLTGAGRALVGSALLHVAVYAGYVWLISRAGAVFAGQVAYLVTGFGVLWAMLFLGESYSGWVWAALAAMFAGLSLVRPRDTSALS